MARQRKLIRAKSKRQACAIGASKARKAGGKRKAQQKACGAEISLFMRGKKSPRKLVQPRKKRGKKR